MKIVAAGTNPVQLTRGIERTVAALVKELKSIATDVNDEDVFQSYPVSTGSDRGHSISS